MKVFTSSRDECRPFRRGGHPLAGARGLYAPRVTTPEPPARQEWRPPPVVEAQPEPAVERVESRLAMAVRLLCAVVLAVCSLALLAYEGRPASDLELIEDAQAGRLRAVVVTADDVLWRTDALRPYRAEMPVTVEERAYTSRQVADLLARYAPDGEVDVTRRGSLAPRWVLWPRALALLSAFLLILGGPVPWRANRWAWFWLLGPGDDGALGAFAFLVLSGRTPGLPAPRAHARRLDGWRGFLLAILLGFAVSLLWSQLRDLGWPATDGGASVVHPPA